MCGANGRRFIVLFKQNGIKWSKTMSLRSLTDHTHTHMFNGPLSATTRVSRYQQGKTIWILLEQETVSGSGISWAICKAAPRSRQITTPAPHHSVFYRPDALPAAQPTASKHWKPRSLTGQQSIFKRYYSKKHLWEFCPQNGRKTSRHRYGTKLHHCHPVYCKCKVA